MSDWHLWKYFLSIFQIWTAPASYEELCLRTDVEIWNADTAGEIIILKSLFFVSFHVYFSRLFLFVFCCQEAVFYQRPGDFYHSNWLPSQTRQIIKSFTKSRTRKTIIPGGHVFGRATYNVHVLLEHVSLLVYARYLSLLGCVWQSPVRFWVACMSKKDKMADA